ncbi:replication factor C subunit 4-like isoform X1 [Pecten maximus]|uniref:replication factor C subunit 4-like isoform X1 n=1 Tax=Pecten maximus TaxID=6579 RepID=UPI001458F926|nr:replication factor C subunit 4-like isoform X1 [Pecten maximus]XP_033759929.1 replication factor C subunit 4-like isoform X1 [Pecten maximus]
MHAFLKGGSAALERAKEKSASSSADKEEQSKKTRQVPWVEKYRPRSVDDVAYQDEVVAVLKKSLQCSDLPNLLFYGPPGTGKTSTILAAARDLFGPEMFKNRVLELNASDERGIGVVRDKVKRFSQQTASGTRPDGKPCPPFKIIILDEADSMTSPAQAALRRTMEKETKTTRFCLICNYVSRIIEPIASRCAKFRFKPLSEDTLTKRLKGICDKESISCDDEGIKALLRTSEGDLRKAITYLQSASRLKTEETITEADINEIAGVVPDQTLDDLIVVCSSDSYEKLDAGIQGLINDGHSASQVITQMHEKLIEKEDLSDKQKAVVFEKLAVVDKCLMDGADEYLQLMALFTTIMHQVCHG